MRQGKQVQRKSIDEQNMFLQKEPSISIENACRGLIKINYKTKRAAVRIRFAIK